ncbi:hypothetical protein V6R21_12180 [Limibacter armeniacum]|uniref:hypothetical protein n=1 Tax=Limibacter armeniacum TaxID=466084 RepID=UPI002FE5063A
MMAEDKNKKAKEVDESGEINWEALEAADRRDELGDEETPDVKQIEKEKETLSDEEKSSPYPDDFLADWNLLRKTIEPEDEEEGDHGFNYADEEE